MIKEIRLTNFQAHRNTVLDLHPGLNVIAGSSNSGKSSILRAFNWVKDNRPSGDAFVSHWARDAKGNQKEDTVVTLVDDHTTIERRKSKATGNTYKIGDTLLEAIGLDVPEEVSTALNLTEVNAQRQHDAPFLLNDSPGEVARFFNKIVHFDAIDAYLSALESKKRKTKADKETALQMIERLDKDLAQFDWLERAEAIIHKIEGLEKTLTEKETLEHGLDNSIASYQDAQEKLPALNKIIKLASVTITEIQEKAQNIAVKVEEASKLNDSILLYVKQKEIIDATSELPFAEKLVGKINRLNTILGDFKTQEREVAEDISVYSTMQQELTRIGVELPMAVAELPETCPTCGKELDQCSTL